MKKNGKHSFFLLLLFFVVGQSFAQHTKYSFEFQEKKHFKEEHSVVVTPDCRYTSTQGYGYDLTPAVAGQGQPFCFSVQVPDGDYLVTVILGSQEHAGNTSVRAESRRLFLENLPTKAGIFRKEQFLVHKRSPKINGTESVRIKPREQTKLDWDDKLTFEINGAAPQLASLRIEPAPAHTTLFLCGNSTVVNQDEEPWASWGQMIPRFFTEKVCVANYGESGESAMSFLASNRLKKILSLINPGDYVFVEFGHNDEKIKGPGKGAFTSFTEDLRTFVTETRKKGGIPVLITPTERRHFSKEGRLNETHGDFPDATRKLARDEEAPCIDLTALTRTLYETWGMQDSKKAFVHYPAHTFPGQEKPLADNTHFNTYGAYEIAKCVIQGIRDQKLGIARQIKDFKKFNPEKPDAFESFVWTPSPFSDLEKPEGS